MKRTDGGFRAGVAACAAVLLCVSAGAAGQGAGAFRDRLPDDEMIYFLLPDRFDNGDSTNDRGGLEGGRLQTGFDPTSKGFYHGGDLRGVLGHLDYIQSLGATTLWLAPIFKNKPVQGRSGQESAGYHGYWITDFTHVDPHFGRDEDLAALIDAAHARGMKVYLDIVVNHTADVIQYRECPQAPCAYRSRADFPYSRRGGIGGEPINAGFLGDDAAHQTAANFARLTRPDYAYTPYLPPGDERVKVPDWLNDPIYYHNRGDSTFKGESATFGDFAGLDDVFTENPRVVRGFIDIYGAWIDRFGVDGFRIDTAKHVNPEFWEAFVPAMRARAAARGIPNFHIFGEVFADGMNPGPMAVHTRVDKLPAVLDFAFADAVRAVTTGAAGTELLAQLFAQDALYEGGEAAARELPTFISNHDQGRYGYFLHKALPQIDARESLQRAVLAHAMLLLLRGVPTVYYGDEQGFAGRGDDQDARQDMFPTQVRQYAEEPGIDGRALAAGPHFDAAHPLYSAIRTLARLRAAEPALRRGPQIVRSYSEAPGLFAVSRLDPGSGREILVAFNTSTAAIDAPVQVNAESHRFAALAGVCEPAELAPGSYRVHVEALGYVVCATPAQTR